MALTVDATKCPQNHHCPLPEICPVEAITQQGYELPQIDAQKCIECGQCAADCGKQAISKSSNDGQIM